MVTRRTYGKEFSAAWSWREARDVIRHGKRIQPFMLAVVQEAPGQGLAGKDRRIHRAGE